MSASGLIPKAGKKALCTEEEWIFAWVQLSARIGRLGKVPVGSSSEISEHDLAFDALTAELVHLICLPEAQPWLAEIEAGVVEMFGRAS